MKYFHITLLLLLVPLMLAGSFLKMTSPVFGTSMDGKFNGNRSWRIDNVTLEQYQIGNWGISNQFDMVYSTQYPTRMDTLKYYGWDDNGQNWVLFANFSYVYDNTNDYVTYSYVDMQMEGTWFPFMRSNFTYDNQHRLTYALTEMYNPGTQTWSNWMWTQVDFISPTNYSVIQYQAETDTRVQQWTRMQFVWDAQGRIIEETDIVSSDSVNWVNAEKYVRNYHPHDTTTGEIFIYNFSHYLPMQNMLEDVYADDFFGMLSTELNKYWSGTAWQDTYLGTYTYDTSDRLTQFMEQQWMNSMWNNNWQITYSYDANGNQYQTTHANNQNGSMVPEERYTFSWEQTTASDDNVIPAVNSLQLTTSPNPFISNLSISLDSKISSPAQIRIYNLRGQLIRTLPAQTKGTISWDGKDDNQKAVAQGFYIISASSEAGEASVKVLKLR